VGNCCSQLGIQQVEISVHPAYFEGERIENNNSTFDHKKDEAARKMDTEIRSKRLTGTSQYYLFLKKHDKNKKNRNRQAAAD
jgi:hypothetical protein